jgi:hypothetical protein
MVRFFSNIQSIKKKIERTLLQSQNRLDVLGIMKPLQFHTSLARGCSLP